MEDVVLSISRLLSSPNGNAVMSLSREAEVTASSHVCLHYTVCREGCFDFL